MKTFTANETKQNFGQVLDTARTGPVSITKHGRPEFVLTSQEDYSFMVELKKENLRREIQKGIDDLRQGRVSKKSVAEIAAEAIAIHRANLREQGEA